LSVVTTYPIILSSNGIQNGDVLVPAKPDSPGKWLLKRRESDMTMNNRNRPVVQMKLWRCSVQLLHPRRKSAALLAVLEEVVEVVEVAVLVLVLVSAVWSTTWMN